MSINDSLVLHLIKHLVWKSEELTTENATKKNGSFASIKKEDTLTMAKNGEVEFGQYFLGQLDSLQKTISHLQNEFLSFQHKQETTLPIAVNGQKPLQESKTQPKPETTTQTLTQTPLLIQNLLLSPESDLQIALPKSFFVSNQTLQCNYGVETKEKLIYLYAFRLKNQEMSSQLSILLHFIVNKIILSTHSTDIFDIFKEFDRKLLELLKQQSEIKSIAEVDFAFCLIDKMQAKLNLVSSGIDLLQISEDDTQEVISKTITLGNYEVHQVEMQSLQIKRGFSYYLLPQSLIQRNKKQAWGEDFKGFIEEIRKSDAASRSQNCQTWLSKQDQSAFVLSFGF